MRARDRRKYEIRRKILLMIGMVITMALCLFFSIKAFANTKDAADEGLYSKQYRSEMIYLGDTVESIASDNYSFLFLSEDRLEEEIRSINHLSPDEKLIPGNYIVVPYFVSCDGH